MLWRRKWLLASGFLLLLASVVAMSFDFSDGVRLRSNPKYEAAIQMAVIPEGYDSLTQDLGSNSLSGTAMVFGSLLSSPQVAREIADQQGVPVLDLAVRTSGRDRFIGVTVLSDSPEGAVTAALGVFDWLDQRLTEPLLTTSAPTTTIPAPVALDADGRFRGAFRLELDHTLASDSEGLWLIIESQESDGFAYRLADAAEEPSALYAGVITPGQDLSVVLEDAAGTALDVVTVPVPLLPEDGSSPYELVIGLERGLVRGTVENPRLAGSYVSATWLPADRESVATETTEISDVSILLLTDVPVPERFGGRRAPLLIVALMTAGTIALLVLVVVVDSWSQERRRRWEVGTAVPAPSPIVLADQDTGEKLG